MWFWKWKMTLADALSPEGGGEREGGEGEDCESQELINAQRTGFNGGERRMDLRATAQEVAAGSGSSLGGGRGPGPRAEVHRAKRQDFLQRKKRKGERIGIKEFCSPKTGALGQRCLNSLGALNRWSSLPDLPKS